MRPPVAYRSLDPRPKAAVLAGLFVLVAATTRLDVLVGVGGLLVVMVALGRDLRLRSWAGALAPFAYILPVILVLNSLFYVDGAVLWGVDVGPLAVRLTVGGVHTAVVIALRLLVVAGAAAWFGLTTDSAAFERALTSVGVPWRLAFVMSLTMHLVPEMRARFRDIEDTQRARGLSVSGGPLARARARVPTLIPFLAAVIQYGYDLAEALEVRDFGAAPRRTSVVTLSHDRTDYLWYGYALVLFAVAAWALV